MPVLAADVGHHAIDQCRLSTGVEGRQRPQDALARGLVVERFELQVVRVDVRDQRLEALPELRVGVLADGDEEVGGQVVAVHAARQPGVERVAVGVEEPVLELVEDHQWHRPGLRRGGLQRGLQPVRLRHVGMLGQGGDQPLLRVAAPRAVDDRQEAPPRILARRALAQPRGHARVQKRALADAARAGQQRQPRRPQVGDHQLALGVAAEEPPGVRFPEVVQADVRAVAAHGVPVRLSSACCSSTT